MDRLTKRDWTFIAVCVVIFAISTLVALTLFQRAFPEASIDFKYDRESSRTIAEGVLRAEGIDLRGMRNTAVFDADDNARIFLERSLGLDKAMAVMKRDVRLWFWRQRWFRPQQEEEYAASIAPTGELVGFQHKIPEDRAMPTPDMATARRSAESFLARNRIRLNDLQLVSQSERRLPHRDQRIFTYESRSVRPAGAQYRYNVVVDGNVIGDFAQGVRVPDEWQRGYRELRSKNLLAGNVDTVFLGITMVAALATFIIRLRRGDVRVRFLLAIGALSIVLVTGVALNSFPSALAGYDTTTSYAAFVAQFVVGAILQSLGTAMLLIVICGAGEVLYRERMPRHLAISRIWTPRALGSKRLFRSFILAYTLVAFFLAYQVVFYIVAGKFGAWSPAEIPYDDILNSAIPWVAVLFAGFFPALSEEFLSRAFSIPFFHRVLRSRVAAIIVAGFIWGFGHATYPNQPFYIRGVEVGFAGVLLGVLFEFFGLLPLLIWHYTVDAFYTALLLFRSHNTYYVVSAAFASFIFAVPLLVSIALYVKRRGFLPDDDLTNATMPVSAGEAPRPVPEAVELPPPVGVPRALAIACVVAVCVAVALLAVKPASPDDAVDYRISKADAKRIARAHLETLSFPAGAGQKQTLLLKPPQYSRVIATTLEGFRSWDRSSPREDGGSPGGFDSVAAESMLASGLRMDRLVDLFRTKIEAATWTVRFFTPMKKEEYFVEVDPRAARAIGFHKYQEEKNAGARLDQPLALAMARKAFAAYGADAKAFDLKEALSFQQPARRDWLFHFDERPPIVRDTFRRISVRVAGAEVTQFTTTVKVPEAVYRAAGEHTIRNVVLVILRIAGGVMLLALVVAGFVSAGTKRRPHWKRALRWTIALAIVPVVSVAAGYEASLFGYNTSVKWDTFFAGLTVDVLRDVALRVGVLFLAVAAIDAIVPFGLDLISREGRARFGRNAVVAAIAALATFASVRVLVQLMAQLFPAAANVNGIEIPPSVATPFPSIVAVLEAAYDAVVGSGVVAAFAAGIRTLPRRPWVPAIVTFAVIFCAGVDSNATLAQMPLMLGRVALLGVLAWIIARYVLDGNLLAWPVTIFIALVAEGIIGMAENHRADLRLNAAIVAVMLIAAIAWLVQPGRTVREREEIIEPPLPARRL